MYQYCVHMVSGSFVESFVCVYLMLLNLTIKVFSYVCLITTCMNVGDSERACVYVGSETE